jgi:2-C-methyl-D-erythritol 4-phosphate cytidylyltransferase
MAANRSTTVAAILVAAGSGERLGAGRPKAFVTVAGRTLLEHAADRFVRHPRIASVVVVAPADRVDEATVLTGAPAVAGGATRQDSVARGLAALPSGVDGVLVHDVARAFVPLAVIDSVIGALDAGAEAVTPSVPLHDTIRQLDDAGGLGGVVDRARLVAVQTPQGFRRDVLERAHRLAAPHAIGATDDATLAEALGCRVVAVAGADANFKITTPLDLVRAEALAVRSAGTLPSIPGGMS